MTSTLNQTAYTLANSAQLVAEVVLALQGQTVGQAISESHFTRNSLFAMTLASVREKVATRA